MTSTSSSGARSATGSRTDQQPAKKEIHHGRTGAAWAGSMITLAAFVIGAIGILLGPNWVIFGIGVVLAVIAIIVTVVMRKLGFGAD
jgi:hypothetical protein